MDVWGCDLEITPRLWRWFCFKPALVDPHSRDVSQVKIEWAVRLDNEASYSY